MEELKYKSIQELTNTCFVVPSFQRGYRWNKDNIIKLFNDILENDSGYLLHSLFVGKVDESKYYIIDGQQRLTAIKIIMAVVYRKLDQERLKHFIPISYESREWSEIFLEFLYCYRGEISTEIIREQWEKRDCHQKKMNLDFEYMVESYVEISALIEEMNKDQFNLSDFGKKVLESKFIWMVLDYEEREDLIDKFGKINMGKIPLDDAELIKSDFLNYKHIDVTFKDNTEINMSELEMKQREILEKWNEIEKKLHVSDFWAFIPHQDQYKKKDPYHNRISYIFQFDLFKDKLGKTGYEKFMKDFTGDYGLYYSFMENFKEKEITSLVAMETIYSVFKEIEALYHNDGRSLDYLGDSNIYNLISYLVHYSSVNKEHYLESFQLFYEILEKNRDERELWIKAKIKEKVFGTETYEDKILNLKYEESKPEIKKEMNNILLLYNIILLNSTQGVGNRYNFLEHSSKQWTAEHIYPQNCNDFNNDDQKLNEKRKEILNLITANLNSHKHIEKKHEYALRYINFKFRKEKETDIFDEHKNMKTCHYYPTSLESIKTNKNGEIEKKFCYDPDKIEKLRKSDDEYENTFGDQMYLLTKSVEILETIDFSEQLSKMLGTGKEKRKNKETTSIDKREYVKEHKNRFSVYEIPLISNNTWENFLEEFKIVVKSFEYESKKKLEEQVKLISDQIKGDSSDFSSIFMFMQQLNRMLYWESLNNLDSLEDEKIDRIIEKCIEKENEKVNEFFNKEFNDLMLDHSIGNIALLDDCVNTELGNKGLSEKRVAIFDLMKKGEFVPLSTILTFANVFTENKDMEKYWLYKSRLNYLTEMIKTIKVFFELKNKKRKK